MAPKKLKDIGIAPNLLLKDVEVTAPYLFAGELDESGPEREYLRRLRVAKKNLKQLQFLELAEYFHLCLSAHWATAGSFVPTNVDNQIREGLWRHPEIQRHIDRMGQLTLESWRWDYRQVTNRVCVHPETQEVLSTHEGTWLSVAIGAFCALKKHKRPLAADVLAAIVAEIRKEELILLEYFETKATSEFLRACALMAHNLGDLDRVIDQWELGPEDPVRAQIYKLGHRPHPDYSPVLCYAGAVNKALLSVENHRHMSLRQPRCLRRSHEFLVPVGPFMDAWGEVLGRSPRLSDAERGEIVAALFEGYNRQNQAFGYPRAFAGMLRALPQGLDALAQHLPFDLVLEIKKSPFAKIAEASAPEFAEHMATKLRHFICPLTEWRFPA